MTKEEIDAIVEQTKRLKIRQETPDSDEALASIPLLELSDLNPNMEAVERRGCLHTPDARHNIPNPYRVKLCGSVGWQSCRFS